MAEVIFWRGHATKNTAKLCLRADTTGTYEVRCNGRSYTLALDPAVDYGVGVVEINGLAANQRAPFQVLLGNVVQTTGEVRAAPGDNDSFYVAFGSCISIESDPVGFYRLVRDYDIRAFFAIGDVPYIDAGVPTVRFAATALTGVYAAPTDINSWHAQYLSLQRDIPGWRYLSERVPLYRMWDDHDSLCNDFDHEFTNVNTQFTSNGGSAFGSQALLDASFNLGRQAFDVWTKGNPASDWPYAAAYKPASAAAGTSVNNYPPQYYSVRLGPASFHVLDCISHRNGIAGAVVQDVVENLPTARTMLGAPQLKGLKAQLLGSPTEFNAILSPKMTYKGATTSDNHGWSDFAVERAHLLEWISRFARGVVWGVGDVHTSSVLCDEFHACVNANPISGADSDGGGSPNLGTGYIEGYVWKADGYNSSNFFGTTRAVCLIHVTPDHLDWIILTDVGLELTRWRQYPGKNMLHRIS